jgi:hypothetical protein
LARAAEWVRHCCCWFNGLWCDGTTTWKERLKRIRKC